MRQCSAKLFWLLQTSAHNTWLMEWLARSITPSICGWNEVDMRSFVPMSQCSSFQNLEANFGSQLDMIDSGIPWSLTISVKNNHMTAFIVMHVVIGSKCTCDVNLLIMTNR